MTGLLQTTGRRFLRPFKMMNIRWGRYIPSALRVITAACATGYAARSVKPAAFPRRCFITSRHLPSVFSISITGTFEAAYFLGHHPYFYRRLGATITATAKKKGCIGSLLFVGDFMGFVDLFPKRQPAFSTRQFHCPFVPVILPCAG